jgi:hypothetical protein
MKLTDKQKEDFNQACCVAMECRKVWDITPFLNGAKSGKSFADMVQHYLLITPDKSYSMNGEEMKKLARTYNKYHKLLKKNRKAKEV